MPVRMYTIFCQIILLKCYNFRTFISNFSWQRTCSTLPMMRKSRNASWSDSSSHQTRTSWMSNAQVCSSKAAHWLKSIRSRSYKSLNRCCECLTGCYKITTVFSHAQTVVLCVGCSTVLCQPTGGKARLTEGLYLTAINIFTIRFCSKPANTSELEIYNYIVCKLEK